MKHFTNQPSAKGHSKPIEPIPGFPSSQQYLCVSDIPKVHHIKMNHHRAIGAGTRFVSLLKRLNYGFLLSLWVTGVTPSWAVDRVLLGHPLAVALADRAEPGVAQTLGVLRQQAASAGTVRIIVGVRAAFAPEGLLASASVAQQREDIANAHSALLNKLVSLKQEPHKVKRFQTIPFMALQVSPAELEALTSLPEVTSIQQDRLALAHLAQSAPLIGASNAWASGYSGAGQTVAILDTGVDKTHPFLAGKVVSEACYSTNSAADGASSICPGGVASSTATGSAMPYASGVCPAGECDHGTHVAGIAVGNGASLPGIGYAGVAKDASLIAVQVFSRFTPLACASALPCAMTYQSDEIRGLERIYALRKNYHIAAVNMSLGGGSYSSQSTCDADNLGVKAAIDNLRAANIATVIASGNDGFATSMSAPACISSAISVGATWDVAGAGNSCSGNNLGTSSVDAIACFSDSASFLNLLAPGKWIKSSVPGPSYDTWAGTSMAAPHVAGAWALLKQGNPSLTVAAALNTLSTTGLGVTDPRNGIVKPRIRIDAALAASAPAAHLINLSTRGQVLSADKVLIGGFTISGTSAKKVLIRAAGPSLANYGLTGALLDPTVRLYSGQTMIASNNDWGTAANAAEIQATGLAPGNAKESAILASLNPGAYTAMVSGLAEGTGIGIVEVFEVDNPSAPFTNISTRGEVQTGDKVLIGGFIIQGDSAQTVLIRAVGPNLANYGVPDVLANPKLDLYSGQTVIASNDNWGNAANAAAIAATGLAPAYALEAAILMTLPPGAYTAIVSGVGGGTGVGIVEVFAQ